MTNKYNPPIYENYNHPSEIRDDASLTHTEKMSMLETWAEDAEALAIAASEGMTDQEGSNTPLLADVRSALEDIKNEDMHGEGNAKADQRYRERLQTDISNRDISADAKKAARIRDEDNSLKDAAAKTAQVAPKGENAASVS